MKNLIKVSAVSLVALALLIGSVGSAMAGSYKSYKSKYSSSKINSGQKSNYRSFKQYTRPSLNAMRAPLRTSGQGQIVNGGGRTTGVAENRLTDSLSAIGKGLDKAVKAVADVIVGDGQVEGHLAGKGTGLKY